MKQTLSLLLVWALLCSCFLLPAGAEETHSPTLGELVAQLKAEETVEELWVPVFDAKSRRTITDLVITEAGSYYFKVQQPDDCAYPIYCISFVTADNNDARISPYQVLMKQKYPDSSLALRWEQVQSITLGDEVVYQNQTEDVEKTFTAGCAIMGEYRNRPMVVSDWQICARRMGDICLGWCCEGVIGLSDTMAASAICTDATVLGAASSVEEFYSYVAANLELGFTTLGDADTDGQVDAADALAILKHSVGKSEIADALAFLMADTDDSGTLDAADALSALRIAVGK